jgi:restriction system protein
VLQQFGNRQPMHYRDIAKKALELRLIESASQTPEVVMLAVILSDNQRRIKRGELPRFNKLGKGLIGLAQGTESSQEDQSLATLIEQHNKNIRNKLHEQIRQMKPADFEALVGRLLTALGFESVSVTRLSGDGGIDVTGILVVGDVVRIRMAVQAKRWKNNVQAPIVQGLRGSLGIHEQGLIITTSDFSKGARDEAMRPNATPIALMSGDQLVKLLIENDIGIKRTTHDLIELGEDDDEELFPTST